MLVDRKQFCRHELVRVKRYGITQITQVVTAAAAALYVTDRAGE